MRGSCHFVDDLKMKAQGMKTTLLLNFLSTIHKIVISHSQCYYWCVYAWYLSTFHALVVLLTLARPLRKLKQYSSEYKSSIRRNYKEYPGVIHLNKDISILRFIGMELCHLEAEILIFFQNNMKHIGYLLSRLYYPMN